MTLLTFFFYILKSELRCEVSTMYYLKKIIEDLRKRDDVIFMTSSQIGDWFVKEDGTNGENLKPFLEQPPD